MDIKTTSSTVTKTAEANNNTSSSSATATKDSSTSFKDELQAAKAQETKDSDTKAAEAKETQNAQKTADEKAAQEVSKEETQKNDKTTENPDNKRISDPLKELNAQLATLNGIKGMYNTKTNSFELKAEETSKKDYCATLKMDNKDINFFVNLVANQQMTAQTAQLNNIGIGANNNNFNEIKSEATQKTVAVSATLMDAINESVKTGKPFRIDFGNDVAVIMRVNKDGQLSANFIPGSSAVEQYLRNNIETLRQSFDEQNLPYEQLSYSRQQNKEQQNQHKENDNE